MAYCPNCGTENPDDAKFCKSCGRPLDDVRQAKAAMNPPTGAPMVDNQGRMIADDGLPVGEDIDGIPGGERVIWTGRPHSLRTPIASLTHRYKLTNERLQVDNGFISRDHEEMDLYRVQDVEIKQGVLARLLDYGDVWIFSSDQTSHHFRLRNVTDPVRVKDLVRSASRIERQRRRVMFREEV